MPNSTLPPLETWRLVTLGMAAKDMGIPRPNIRMWRDRVPDFPPPLFHMGHMAIYDLLTLRAWVASNAPAGYLARRSLGKL